jgi:hypothetical protein
VSLDNHRFVKELIYEGNVGLGAISFPFSHSSWICFCEERRKINEKKMAQKVRQSARHMALWVK